MIPMPEDEASWEAILTAIWTYLTPVTLTLCVIILIVRITHLGNWGRRMSRGTFVLVLSYAVIIDRIFLRNMGIIDAPLTRHPEPFWAAFYVLTTAYFLYALVLEHVLPALVSSGLRLTRWIGRDTHNIQQWADDQSEGV